MKTLIYICEIERIHVLTVSAISAQNPWLDRVLPTGKCSRLLHGDVSSAWLDDCPAILSP